MTTEYKVLNGFDVKFRGEMESGYFDREEEAIQRAIELGANILVRGGKEGSKYYFKYVENDEILEMEMIKNEYRNIKNHKLWILDSSLSTTRAFHTIKYE